MALINVPDINNLDAATPALFNSRFGEIADEINGNLDAANLADGAVTAPKLATDSVTTGKIADANVTPAKWTNPYRFSVYRNSAATSGNGAFAKIAFDTEIYDPNNDFDITTNNRYTAPVAGVYHFSLNAAGMSLNSSNIQLAIYKNGVAVKNSPILFLSFASTAGREVSGDILLAAGDYVEGFAYGNGGSLTVGAANLYFDGFLVSKA